MPLKINVLSLWDLAQFSLHPQKTPQVMPTNHGHSVWVIWTYIFNLSNTV